MSHPIAIIFFVACGLSSPANTLPAAKAAASSTFSGQSIFEADAGDYLTLGSTGAITLPAGDQTPVATLTLMRIGD